MQNIRQHLHFIWADKIALGAVVLALFLTGMLWLLAALAAGPAGANHVLGSISQSVALDGFIAVAVLWVALRAIDYLRGGSTHKLFRTARDIATHPVGGKLAAH